MKFYGVALQSVEAQLGVSAVEESDPGISVLLEAFGEHSFFLDSRGLHIVEPESSDASQGVVVRLAVWDEDQEKLRVDEQEELPFFVDLAADGPNPVL